MEIVTEKRCASCGETKSLSEFKKDKRNQSGLAAICRACGSLRDKAYYQLHAEQIKQRVKEYEASHPEESRAWARAYNRRHADVIREYRRALHEQKKDEQNEYVRQWANSHPDMVKNRLRRWRTAHPVEAMLQVERRRQLRINAPGAGVTREDWEAVLGKYGHRCLACGSSENLTLDHVVPLYLGGAHDPSNIQPLCGSCNSRKGRKETDYR